MDWSISIQLHNIMNHPFWSQFFPSLRLWSDPSAEIMLMMMVGFPHWSGLVRLLSDPGDLKMRTMSRVRQTEQGVGNGMNGQFGGVKVLLIFHHRTQRSLWSELIDSKSIAAFLFTCLVWTLAGALSYSRSIGWWSVSWFIQHAVNGQDKGGRRFEGGGRHC